MFAADEKDGRSRDDARCHGDDDVTDDLSGSSVTATYSLWSQHSAILAPPAGYI